MAVTVRNPTAEELPAVWEVLCGAFGEGPRERFRRQIWEDSTFALEQIRIAEVEGKIVSHVWVAERPVFYRGHAVLPMGGIGGVGTLPEYRGHGLATLLLQDAIAYMEGKGHAISMLFTGINPFYARLGWADFPEWRFRIKVRRVPTGDEMPPDYFVRPYEPDQDLPALQALYRQHIAALQLSLPHARPDTFWRDGHPQLLGLQPTHIVATGAGDIVAYACAVPTEHGLRLGEFAYAPTHPAALTALAVALARDAVADGKEGVISGVTPWLHPLPQTIAALTDGTLGHEVTEHMMLRVVNLRRCLEAVQPTMETSLRAMRADGLQGAFCFCLSQPEQAVTVTAVGGKVTVRDDDSAAVTLTVTPRQFCLLLFGAAPAPFWRHLLRDRLTDEQVALLSALFPPHPTVYWSGDHF